MSNYSAVTIPRELAERGDLVMIPRIDYQAFKQWQKITKIDPEDAWFWTPEWQKKEAEVDEEIRKGKLKGPFRTHKALMKALNQKP